MSKSKSKRRRVFHQPKQTMPTPSPEIANILRQALALHQQGQLAQAESLYRAILEKAPNHFDAKHLLGVVEHQRKNFAAAVQLIGQALKLNPESAPAQSNMGNALHELKHHDEALASYDRALAIKPDYGEAFYNRGNALRGLNRHEEALASYDRAMAITPDYAAALYNRGNAFLDLQRHGEALASYDHALAIKPDYPEALYNRANALRNLKRHEEAAKEFERLVDVKPDYDYARGEILNIQSYCCNWRDYNQNVERTVKGVLAGKRVSAPFAFISVSESSSAQLQCARTYSNDKYAASRPAMWQGERYRHDKIRVAYLSADFHHHATAHLMVGLFEAHDKLLFETTAISFGPDSKDDLRTRLENSFTHFIDVRNKNDRDTANCGSSRCPRFINI